MKFSCNQQLLSKALNTVSKAVTTRTTIPILKGILLEASDDGELKLAASDLDLSIEKKLVVNVAESGSTVVSARLFSDIIRKLPNEEVEIEEEENNVIIRCLASEFKIIGQPADEFPNIGEVNEAQRISISGKLLCDMIRKTSFAASIDESKGIIVGILMEINEDGLTLAALDGFRMAVAREKMTNAESAKIVIASRILNEINKIVGDGDGDEDSVDLILDEKKAVVVMSDTKMVLRLLEGEFIKYADIIPKENKCRVLINRGEFADSMERASLLAKEGKNNLIKMSLFRDKMIITSRSEEGNVKEEVFIEKDGDDLDIGFNSKYILDVLKVVGDETIAMEFNSSVSPCLIKPVEGDAFEYLVLPVRISNN